MIVQISLDLLRTCELVGRDRVRIGDLEYRVTGWHDEHRALLVAPISGPDGFDPDR